jgi:hypothetical protein
MGASLETHRLCSGFNINWHYNWRSSMIENMPDILRAISSYGDNNLLAAWKFSFCFLFNETYIPAADDGSTKTPSLAATRR